MRWSRLILGLALALTACSVPPPPPEATAADGAAAGPALVERMRETEDAWRGLVTEARIDELVLELSRAHRQRTVLFENVSLVTLGDDPVVPGRSVLVDRGWIARVDDAGSIDPPPGALLIDGTGKYLMPGLTDAHVHVGPSHAEKLLELAAGVTTVREMAGFPWLLDVRDRISGNEILAPNLYLTGPMLNAMSLGVFTRVVTTPEEARERVRAQKKAGYDFVKVWNVMPLELLEAIADEAAKQGLDVVGHVPHGVTIEQALALGMTTLEHLKGYYLDRTLEPTDEDYVAVSRAHDGYWICPTLVVAHRQALEGEDARRWLAEAEEARYVRPSVRARWLAAATEERADADTGRRIVGLQRQIFPDLVAAGLRNFLAGTDTNGFNPFMVAGFDLHHELRLLAELGLPIADVLRAATVHPARALGLEGETGTIEVGKRADLLLLEENPLEDLDHLLGRRAVTVRGIYLSERDVEAILDAVAAIYREEAEIDVASDPAALLERLLAHDRAAQYAPLRPPLPRILLSRRLAEVGRTADAVEVMERAAELYPYDNVYEALGDAYAGAGDAARVRESYRRAVDLYPYNQSAKEKLESMEDSAP